MNIWYDKWVPIPNTFKIQSPRRGLEGNARVKDFIDPDTKQWNLNLQKEVFSKHEVDNSSRIPSVYATVLID